MDGTDQIDTTDITRVSAAEVDDRQDELMASESAEGRPPTHQQRSFGWRWFLILIPIIVVGSGVIALMRGLSLVGIAQFGVLFVLLLVLGGLPRWGASLSRGKEEAAARKEAVAELGVIRDADPQTVDETIVVRD